MADPTAQVKETPKAAQSFADYVALGPNRSLRALAQQYVNHKYAKSVPTQLNILKRWSSEHHWQDRIANAATAFSENLLNRAAELDADTFYASSVLLNKHMVAMASSGIIPFVDEAVKVRESVRKPAPKGTATLDVNVNVGVEIREFAERIAAQRGIDANDVIAEAERLLAANKS